MGKKQVIMAAATTTIIVFVCLEIVRWFVQTILTLFVLDHMKNIKRTISNEDMALTSQTTQTAEIAA